MTLLKRKVLTGRCREIVLAHAHTMPKNPLQPGGKALILKREDSAALAGPKPPFSVKPRASGKAPSARILVHAEKSQSRITARRVSEIPLEVGVAVLRPGSLRIGLRIL